MSLKNHTAREKNVAVVLGGYVNGYSIIRELHGCGVRDIALIDYAPSLSSFSNKISISLSIDRNENALLAALNGIHKRYDRLVLFPTDDLQLEWLHNLYFRISSFCFIPFNPGNLLQYIDKSYQYAQCELLGIPCPRTHVLTSKSDWAGLSRLTPPFIVKPAKRDDLTTSVFRNAYFASHEQIEEAHDDLFGYVCSGVPLIVSECVPGDDTHIFAYTAYRSANGKIVNEWVGKKLSQYPDKFGVFSSAVNSAPDIVREQGRKLLDGMNLWGIAEPEFKLDARDGSYKLMEVNLRSMMWHRTGCVSGVRLQYSQWLDALGQAVPPMIQQLNKRHHFVYMKHEVLNLITRSNYWRRFYLNVFGGDRLHFAVFNWSDVKPFFYDLSFLFRGMMRICLRRLRKL